MKNLTLLFSLLLISFTNAKAQWTDFQSPVFANSILWSVQVIDASHIWAVDFDNGQVIKTSNGGQTWAALPINDPSFSNYGIYSITALDANTAWVTASTGVPPLRSRIYKTTNGGLTWQHQVTPLTNPGANGYWAFINHFFDASNGVNIGELHVPNGPNPGTTSGIVILTTSDGGQNWQVVPAANMPPHPGYSVGVFYRAFSVVGNTIWFMTMEGKVYKSTNKGLNWTVSDPGFPLPGGTSYSLAFSDTNNGLATNGNYLFKTTDGGTTWINANATGKWFGNELAYVTGTAGTFISAASKASDPGSSISIDNGNNWAILETTNRHWDMHFLDAATGWSAGLGKMMKFAANTTGTVENSEYESFFIYPNPGKGLFHISTVSNKPFRLEIYDLTGKKIMAQAGNSFGKTILDLSGKQKGIFTVHILSGQKRLIEKIVLQ